MKPALTFVLLLSFSFSCFSQIERESINFLEGLIRRSQPEGQIVYTNKINSNVLLKLQSELKKSKIYGTSPETKENFIELTRPEKNYLLEQLENFAKPYWSDNLFTNSKVIEEEKSETYIKRAHQEYSEAIQIIQHLTNPTLLKITTFRMFLNSRCQFSFVMILFVWFFFYRDAAAHAGSMNSAFIKEKTTLGRSMLWLILKFFRIA